MDKAEKKITGRNSNIEFLRIAAMMGVVGLHYVKSSIGGIEQYSATSFFVWMFVNSVRSIAVPLVNVFILITGYYMVCKDLFSYRKMMDIIAVIIFYGICKTLLGLLFYEESFSASILVRNVFPVFFGSSWFVKTYLILYLFIPFLNKCLVLINQSSFTKLLFAQIMIFSVWSSIGFDAPVKDNGYGIINFITLYIIGAYIRLHSRQSKVLMNLNSFQCFLCYCFCVITTNLSGYFINPFGYNFITNVLGAAFLFVAVAKMKYRSTKWINMLAGSAFDVFFAHGKAVFQIFRIGSVPLNFLLIPHILLTMVFCYLFGFLSCCIRRIVFKYSVNRVLSKSEVLNRNFMV